MISPQFTTPERTPAPALDAADRSVLVAQIDILATALARDFYTLPPRAQAGALELGHTLAALRLTLLEMKAP